MQIGKQEQMFLGWFCLHSPRGNITKEMSSTMASTFVEEVLPNNSPGRRLWSRGRLLLCIYRTEHSPSHNTSQWLLLGDGNFDELSFESIPLKRIPDGHPVAVASRVVKLIALQWQGEEPVYIYKFVSLAQMFTNIVLGQVILAID